MPYLVVVRELIKGKPWNTITKEFADEESANEWAKSMYDSHEARMGDICVTIYRLVRSMN